MRISLLITLFLLAKFSQAQQLDSIYINLYTDSLKKGTFNYINVEGRYNNGKYLPLGPKDLRFTSSAGKFDGNSLYIDSSFREEKIKVTATAIANPRLKDEKVIYIKKYEVIERLPTMDEILHRQPASKKRSRRG